MNEYIHELVNKEKFVSSGYQLTRADFFKHAKYTSWTWVLNHVCEQLNHRIKNNNNNKLIIKKTYISTVPLINVGYP